MEEKELFYFTIMMRISKFILIDCFWMHIVIWFRTILYRITNDKILLLYKAGHVHYPVYLSGTSEQSCRTGIPDSVWRKKLSCLVAFRRPDNVWKFNSFYRTGEQTWCVWRAFHQMYLNRSKLLTRLLVEGSTCFS